MSRQVALFWAAVQFLTRAPTPKLREFQADWTARSTRYFALVGAMLGGACGLVLLGAAQLWTGALPALLAVLFGVLVTGAFHEDGLADAFDGLGGGQTRERRLQIMKDSRIGTFGALALGFVLGAKVLALGQIPPLWGAAALVAAHAGARAAAVTVMRVQTYAGDPTSAKVKAATGGASWREAAFCIATAAAATVPLLWIAPGAALAATVASIGAVTVFSLWGLKALGGWVGDTLGATEQIYEAAFALAVAGALSWS
ncbi:MAG: adenosylcobinamide-GDP ribazoletransferase [Proteobacteria bacterium]|nr:adenosylcobinamide-GDP ribazoletransferase [Pseudomonadota bacterium]